MNIADAQIINCGCRIVGTWRYGPVARCGGRTCTVASIGQLEACINSKCFTVIDCRSGYNQCKILPSDKEKTTFWWGRTRYQYTRLVMGMKNATAHFQRVMDHLLGAAGLSHCAFAYVDDVLIHSPTPEQHIIDVSAVLAAMKRDGMKVHPEKCVIGTDVIPFLTCTVASIGPPWTSTAPS